MPRAITQEFLNEVLAKEDTKVEDKVKLIIAEHEAETRGLVQKKDQLLAQEVGLKKQINEFTEKEKAYNEKFVAFEEELKKKSGEDHKQFFENKYKASEKEWAEKLKALEARNIMLEASHSKRLRDDAINEGLKDIAFVDGLRDGYVARVLAMQEFEAKEIDGKTLFLNKDNKEIKDVMHEFALTSEGKAYIKNPASGGGAGGSGGSRQAQSGVSMTRERFEQLNPTEKRDFLLKSGKITDQ